MDWKHPTYYKALEKQRKEFEASERAQADKRASELASGRSRAVREQARNNMTPIVLGHRRDFSMVLKQTEDRG